VKEPPTSAQITLGILAGGRASRLGGLDKAWLQREGQPQVLRWRDRFADQVSASVVSANRDLPRYAAASLEAVTDSIEGDAGPIAGLAALAAACNTPWLLTIPVDLLDVNDNLLPMLVAGRGDVGAYACDDDGVQPLVALWRVSRLRQTIPVAIASGDGAVQSLQRRLDMAPVRYDGVRFGNLNTAEDLANAGIHPGPER
jgi:molybdopterin-guanine dinucleotide biosynthesis protein A